VIDPLPAHNRRVRAFAKANRLRVAVRDDGEVALLLGPRRPQSAAICRTGRTFQSDTHASFGVRGDLWRVYYGPATTRRVRAIGALWRDLGLAPVVLDFEAFVDVPEARLLEVADAHRLTRSRRRRELSPEARAAAVARMARIRPRPLSGSTFQGVISAPAAPARPSGRSRLSPAEPASVGGLQAGGVR
jgi:hypothetical protein